eukprot:4668904-Ditylum_brightwellii.AAC.1
MKNLIEDQGSFVSKLLSEMSNEDIVCVVKNVANLFINTIKGLSEIVAKRDSRNQAADLVNTKLPPVVHQDLIKICNAEFCAIVRKHKQCLQVRWNEREIDFIEQEHRELLDAACNKMVLRGAIQSLKPGLMFDDS